MNGERMVKPLLSQPIAEGRTAEIYVWDEGQVLKLYRDWCPPDWVEYESWIAQAVHEAGVPSPAAREIVEVNERRGLLYERLEGISMLQEMNARPWTVWKHARLLAELHAQLNQQSIGGLPSYKDRLRYDVQQAEHLSADLREKVLSLLEVLPAGQNLCHGDYHPGNIFLTHHGPVVIDWMTASSGSPWTDVARTSLILSIGARAAGKQVHPLIRMVIRFYHHAYLDRYRTLQPDTEDELARWRPIVAAARLSENIIPEREALIKMVKESLLE